MQELDSQPPACAPFGALREALADDHVVAVLMDEHARILEVLARLETCVQEPVADARQYKEIEGLAERLLAAEPHHQREERVLFPAIRARGVAGPPDVMEAEHVELRALKNRVREGSRRAEPETWSSLREDALRLVDLLRIHIQKENEILFPMAVRLIEDPAAWAAMKEQCDEIGYCCQGGGDHF